MRVRVREGDLRKELSRPIRNNVRETANKASRKSLRKLNGFIFQQLSAKSDLILDLTIRNGNFFKARAWKSKQWKRDFPGVVLGPDSNDSGMGGAWLVSGGGSSSSSESPPHPIPWACSQAAGSEAGSLTGGWLGSLAELQRKLLCASAISSKRL